jgi:hypothetical protein
MLLLSVGVSQPLEEANEMNSNNDDKNHVLLHGKEYHVLVRRAVVLTSV